MKTIIQCKKNYEKLEDEGSLIAFQLSKEKSCLSYLVVLFIANFNC